MAGKIELKPLAEKEETMITYEQFLKRTGVTKVIMRHEDWEAVKDIPVPIKKVNEFLAEFPQPKTPIKEFKPTKRKCPHCGEVIECK